MRFIWLILLLLILQPSSGVPIQGSYTDINSQSKEYQDEIEPVIIEAFSTECSHCMDQHPHLADFYDNPPANFTLLSISVNSKDTVETLIEFNKTYPTEWMMGIDSDNVLSDVYGVTATPTFLIFDTGGLRACSVGMKITSELNDFWSAYETTPDKLDACKSAPSITPYILGFGTILLMISFIQDRKKNQ